MLGVSAMTGLTKGIRSLLGQPFPQWSAEMPRATRRGIPATDRADAKAVYFPACISRIMGALPGEPDDMSLMQAFGTLARRANVSVHIPSDVVGVCCGVPFSSKGYEEANRVAVNRAVERFRKWSDGGRVPVVVDTSPCTYGLLHSRGALTPENQQRFDHLTVLDSVEFVHDRLLPHLTVTRKSGSVALHPVCSLVRMNLTGKLVGIAKACSNQVLVPPGADCCGFAGDRGFLFPELTASATRHEAAEVKKSHHDGYFSSSRTCEIGMTRATGSIYRSYLFLLEESTRS